MKQNLAPIALFAYNRPHLFSQVLESLLKNPLHDESDLYIYIDGARTNDDVIKQEQIMQLAINIKGFRKVVIHKYPHNKGLAQSIIDGVSELMIRYDKVIVVEDDLYLSPSFLTYMNSALNEYEDNDKIFQISGFGLKISPPIGYPYDAYPHYRAYSWGWASWSNRWTKVDWKVMNFSSIRHDYRQKMAFNRAGSDLYQMLYDYMCHKNDSWYIRFAYAMYCQQAYCVTPIKSMTYNIGFGEDATHCKNYNRYKVDFQSEYKSEFNFPTQIEINKNISRQATNYYTILTRSKGRIMTWYKQVNNRLYSKRFQS